MRQCTLRFNLRTLFVLFLFFSWGVLAHQPVQAVELKDGELSDLVKQVYVYTFPIHEMYRTRWEMVYDRANPKRADLNQFNHDRKLTDHTQRWVTTPNNDTLYSNAWLNEAACAAEKPK